MRSLAGSLIALVAFVFAAWVVASLLGFDFALIPSIIGSIVLTVVLNLVLRGGRALAS